MNFFFALGISGEAAAEHSGFHRAVYRKYNGSHEAFDWRNYFFLLPRRDRSMAAGTSARC